MPLGKDILFGALPRALNGFTTLGLNIYAARFLAPGEFAVIGFCTTCFIMVDGIVGSALDLAVAERVRRPSAETPDRPAEVEQTAVFLKLVFAALLAMPVVLAGEWLGQRIFQRPDGTNLFALVALAATSILLIRSVQLFYQLRLRFKSSGALDLSLSLFRAVVIVVILMAGFRSGAVILAAHAICLTTIALLFGIPLALRFSGLEPRSSKALWRLARSAAPTLAAFSVGALMARLDIFLVAGRGIVAETGFYTAALTLTIIPEVVASYLAPVLLPRIGLHLSENSFAPFFRKVLAATVGVAATAWVVALALHEPFFRILYSRDFYPSFHVQQILLPGALAAASIMPLTLNFVMIRQPRVFLAADLIFGAALWVSFSFVSNSIEGVAIAVTGLRLAKAAAVHTVGLHLASPPQTR